MMGGLQKLCTWMCSHLVKALCKRSTCILLMLVSSLTAVFIVQFQVLCTVKDHKLLVQDVCTRYEDGDAAGYMCHDLCVTGAIAHQKLSCHSLDLTSKDPAFQGTWGNNTVIFKRASDPPHKLYKLGPFKKKIYPSEVHFAYMLKSKIKVKFNITVTPDFAKGLMNRLSSKLPHKSVDMEDIWTLLHSNEYLALVLYENLHLFPKLIGSCGPLFAVQKMNSLTGYWHMLTLYDRHEEWMKRVKLAIQILDYLLHLDKDLPEPLLVCDMKISHFGLTDDLKKVVYLDLESVHPYSVASRITSNGSHCRRHSDCDYKNCRSFCNLITFKCQHGVVNNNLQIVCEKIFLGWVSNRVMVPGLLIGPRTPRVLTEILELCANPTGELHTPRAPATSDIRKRLHDLLEHLTY